MKNTYLPRNVTKSSQARATYIRIYISPAATRNVSGVTPHTYITGSYLLVEPNRSACCSRQRDEGARARLRDGRISLQGNFLGVEVSQSSDLTIQTTNSPVPQLFGVVISETPKACLSVRLSVRLCVCASVHPSRPTVYNKHGNTF